jgi:hypothetical protein
MSKGGLKWVSKALIVVSIGFLLAFAFFNKIKGFSEEWGENFEEYDVGLLSDNAKWAESASDSYFVTDDGDYVYNGSKAGKVDNTGSSTKNIFYNPDDDIGSGESNFYYWQKPTYWTSGYFGYLTFDLTPLAGVDIEIALENERYESNEFSIRYTGWLLDCETGSPISQGSNVEWGVARVALNEWVKIGYEANFDEKIIKVTPEVTGLDPAYRCFWFNNTATADTLEKIELKSFKARQGFDYFQVWYPAPPPVRVWGVSPENETEITDLNTAFTFGWEGLDDYDGLIVSFYNQTSGIHSQALRLEKEDIGVEGEYETNLEEFDLDKNGDWYLHAIAFWEAPEVQGGIYLTGRYITEYTYDIVSPEYFLTLNIEGFASFFEMADFEGWYEENAIFDEPTALFASIASLFSPAFSNIGEFGNRITDYFETDKAYGMGFDMGKAVPMFDYYLDTIETFFGGFPLLKIFLVILLLLAGIFIFKIILKFVPFIG